jgi:hypothetical protein
LPKDVDPHEFYTLRVENQSYIPKFRTTSTNYKLLLKASKWTIFLIYWEHWGHFLNQLSAIFPNLWIHQT